MLQDPKYNHFHTHDDLSDFCTPTYVYSTFDLNYFYLSSKLHLRLHDVCFVNVFDSFIPVTKLKTLNSNLLFWFEHILC